MEFDRDMFTDDEPVAKPAGKHLAPKGSKAPARERTRPSQRAAARHQAAAKAKPAAEAEPADRAERAPKKSGKKNSVIVPVAICILIVILLCLAFLPKKTGTESPAAASQGMNEAPGSNVVIGGPAGSSAVIQEELPAEAVPEEPEVVEPTEPPKPTPRVDWNSGDTVKFGSYKQDTTGNASPLQWKVLKRDGDYALLVSSSIVKFMKMHDTTESTWDESFIRDWLNNSEHGYGQLYKKGTSFMGTAFTADEKAALAVPADVPSVSEPLQDKVFLLSLAEVKAYAPMLGVGCFPTDYAVLEGQRIGLGRLQEGTARWWWLRTTDGTMHFRFINDVGEIDERVKDADNDYGGIRPAIWVDLTKIPV